jgi:hypothetical protein
MNVSIKNYITVILGIIMLLALAWLTKNIQGSGGIKSCKQVSNQRELSFAESYCQGDMCDRICDEHGKNCHAVMNKEDCESIDVVVEGNIEQWGQDEKSDCTWQANGDNTNACQPNKL